ncbi:MAG: response regulator, partial [Thiomargarita sp.]|nr:response regulator [Thiomargarita sp.]
QSIGDQGNENNQPQDVLEDKKATTLQLATPDILELVCLQINDSSDGFSSAIEVCVSMENDNPKFLEAIEDYTTQVQDIWDTAEMAGLHGLQQVCTFVNDNLLAFSVQENRATNQRFFIEWPAKVLEYLHSPESEAVQLIKFLQEPNWPSPLATDKSESLLTALITPVSNELAVATEVVEIDVAEEVLTPLKIEIKQDIYLGSPEIVEILVMELGYSEEEFTAERNKIITTNDGSPELAESVENYSDQIQRLYVASEMLGLEGLKAICTNIVDNVNLIGSKPLDIRKQAELVLKSWPDLMLEYLKSPIESNILALVNHFRKSAWVQALTDTAAQELLDQLVAGSSITKEQEQAEAYNRQTTASPEDVLLTVPEDINPELMEAYLQEAPQNAQEFSEAIQNIIQGAEVSEVERAQRIAHTLKGSSNIIGIKGIANVAHHLEDTLEYLAKHQVTPPKALTDTMVEAADCMEAMVDFLLGQDDAPSQSLQVLQSVLDWANRIDKGDLNAPPATKATSESTIKPATPQKAPKQTNVAASSPEQFLKVPTKTIDELMRLIGELSISMGQIQEKLRTVTQNTRFLIDRDLTLQQKTFDLENLVDVRGVTGIDNRYKDTAEAEENFDPLEFEEYNELHSVAHSFIEFISDNRELTMSIREDLGGLETMFIHQERLNKEFQVSIMTTRMVPVNTIISKLQRNIRQTCRATSKKAELEVSGSELLIDSDVLSNLADPLQHILRNAVDHGLETPEERIMLDKPESGTIKISFYREGNNMVVNCQDDGQGLNYANIRYTAIQRGLIKENQEVSEHELARLILKSGFSTKTGVTQVSGRGVGMDVVHTNIRQMKGTLDIHSETGNGTNILIKLPMTLVTVHVLIVRVGDRSFGIQTNHLEQALAQGSGKFHKIGEEVSLKMGKNFYKIKSLAKLLHIADAQEITEQERRPIILVHEETEIIAVLVDELLDTHNLVMKTMGKYVAKIRGVAGAAILGNGSLIPLLDLPELLSSPTQMIIPALDTTETSEVIQASIPRIMIVDDSLSVRKSLSLLVEDAGFEVSLAKDGLEAVEMIAEVRPNVMLVDMEMPRMNGLELTAHVRSNQATKKIPIFMITSRTTEKHREQAKSAGVNAYLTKPYQENELLSLIDKALAG